MSVFPYNGCPLRNGFSIYSAAQLPYRRLRVFTRIFRRPFSLSLGMIGVPICPRFHNTVYCVDGTFCPHGSSIGFIENQDRESPVQQGSVVLLNSLKERFRTLTGFSRIVRRFFPRTLSLKEDLFFLRTLTGFLDLYF